MLKKMKSLGYLTMALLLTTGLSRAENNIKALLDGHGSSMVTLRMVLNIDAVGGDQTETMEEESTGVIISQDGLILSSNATMGGFMGMMNAVMSKMGQGQEMTITPTEIKVLIGDDTEGVDATLITRDTDLDLAWFKITDPEAIEFTHVTFEEIAVAAGDELTGMDRLDKNYDRALVGTPVVIGGITKKPRELYYPSVPLGYIGMPVFNADLKPVGLSIFHIPEMDLSSQNPMQQMQAMQKLQGGGSGALILPAKELLYATERVKELLEEEKEE